MCKVEFWLSIRNIEGISLTHAIDSQTDFKYCVSLESSGDSYVREMLAGKS